MRGIIDDRRASGERAGHFLLLGSAAIDLMRQAGESLAGRVASVELSPFHLAKIVSARTGDADRLWVRGGFPESFLSASEEDSLAWRRSFIRSYLERDVPMFAPRLPTETIGRLWTMLAHSQGSLLNQARLASSLAVSAPAAARYIDLLVDLLLVRRLRPCAPGAGTSASVWSGRPRSGGSATSGAPAYPTKIDPSLRPGWCSPVTGGFSAAPLLESGHERRVSGLAKPC